MSSVASLAFCFPKPDFFGRPDFVLLQHQASVSVWVEVVQKPERNEPFLDSHWLVLANIRDWVAMINKPG